MTAVYVYGFAAMTVAALIALVRVERGPSMFDRVVALDIITAVVLGTVTLVSAMTGRTDLVPVLIVVAMVGFVGSVTVARFAAADSVEEARILTRDELAAVLAEQESISDEDAPVHDPDARAAQLTEAAESDPMSDAAEDMGADDAPEDLSEGTTGLTADPAEEHRAPQEEHRAPREEHRAPREEREDR